MQKPLQSNKHAIMQLISTNKYFGKNLQEKLTSTISMIQLFRFITLYLLLAKLAGAVATPKGEAYCLFIIGNCNY